MCTPEDGRPAFRVLVLDPSPFLAERLARLARSCGPVAVELAASGEEALAALRRHPSTVVLAIEDDGVGLDLAQAEDHRSLGLAGMRERATVEGGEVWLGHRPGGGTRVLAWLPLAAPKVVP